MNNRVLTQQSPLGELYFCGPILHGCQVKGADLVRWRETHPGVFHLRCKEPAADGLTKLKKTAEKASLSFSPFPARGNLPMYMPSHGQWVQNRSGVAVCKGFWKDCKEALSGSEDFCCSSSTPPTLTVVPWVHTTPAAKSAPSISLVLEYGKVPASSPEPARNSYTTLPRRGEREGNRIRILTPSPCTSWRPGFSAPTNQPDPDTAAPTCAF